MMTHWMHWGLVACGGALGALCRVGVAEAMSAWGVRSWGGTLLANLLGCLVMGCLKGLVDAHDWGSVEVRIFLMGGFVGAFTTFSTFMADGALLWRQGKALESMCHMGASVAGGAIVFLLGWFVATRVWSPA